MSGDRLTILCGDLEGRPATAAAVDLARWAGANVDARVDIVALWGGPWAATAAASAPLRIVNDPGARPSPGSVPELDLARAGPGDGSAGSTFLAGRVLRAAGLHRVAGGAHGEVLRRGVLGGSGAVWLAGARAARLLHYVDPARRVVGHHGEFDVPIDAAGLDPDDRAVLVDRVDHWVAGSATAASDLGSIGVRGPVEVVPDLLLVDAAVAHPRRRLATRAVLSADAGVPRSAPLVVAPGEIDWWDVPDLFVLVAWEIERRRPAPAGPWMLWAGGRSTDRMLWPLRHDLRHAGLARAAVAPPGLAAVTALAAADVVAVTRRGGVAPDQIRRIEAIGRVVVRPVAPGEQAGAGPAEGTVVVPPLDEEAMAEAVLSALDDPGLAEAAADRAERVRAAHDPGRVGPLLRDRLGLRPR